MKRFFVFSMVLCTAIWFAGCNKEEIKVPEPPIEPGFVIDGNLDDGSIIIDDGIDVTIEGSNQILDAKSTTDKSTSGSKMGVKSDAGLKANTYRFKEVASMPTLKLGGHEVQATDVKITDDGYAFVSYNDHGDAHRGGVVVYRYTVTDGTFETADVDVEYVTGVRFPNAEISAIEFYNNKLYMIGASSEPKFGYDEENDGFNYAFLLVMELNGNKTFNRNSTPKIVKLTSFQGTSIRVRNDQIYVTTGDGTNGTDGGLYIFRTTDYSKVEFIKKENARSVDVDASNVYLMQAQPARITKYDLNGGDETLIYPTNFNDLNSEDFPYDYTNEAMQREAKSEMLVWGNYLFVAMNESGLRMLTKEGDMKDQTPPPGDDTEKHVTNSVSMNTDKKKDSNGNEVQSNLLLLANGEKGVYWYDVIVNDGVKSIFGSAENSILEGDGLSTNFISSKGNVVFVANGRGGLKVLYIGFTEAEDKNDCAEATFRHETFLKANGSSKIDPPLDRKVGDVIIQTEGDKLVVYLWSTLPNYNLKQAGVIFGSSLQHFDSLDGLLTGGGNNGPEGKNINNGYMTNINSDYRTIYSDGSVRFEFPKSVIEEYTNENGELLIIIYSGNNAWGYGSPNGPSGRTGTGVNNNGQIILLKDVIFCE